MKELRLYNISDRYISYLRENIANVYSNKEDNRTHNRKYLGVVIQMSNYNYYIPLSSPKSRDYQYADGDMVIKRSIVPIIRMVRKNVYGKKESLATLRVSHMIPVPESELFLYDIDGEEDSKYRDLVSEEISFIHHNADKIFKNAQIMYKQKLEGLDIGYVKNALDYKKLEELCDKYVD